MFCEIYFLFITNLSQGNFLKCPRFFILTKNLNTAHTPTTEMKQNLLHCTYSIKIFISFTKSLNISLDVYFFSQSVKGVL